MISDRIEQLKSNIVREFGSNLRSILLYGSATQKDSEANDLDIIVILKDKKIVLTDVYALKKTLGSDAEYVDAQLLYEVELAGGNAFSLDTHGPFIVEELKQAVLLYGDNPFRGISLYSEMRYSSVLQKLQYYTFRARQISLGHVVPTKDKTLDFHKKKLYMAMRDLLIAKQEIVESSDGVLPVFMEFYPGVISPEFESVLGGTAPLDISQALPIYEALYNVALSWASTLFPERRKPGIAKEGDIFFEYLLPKETDGIPFVILCEGLPAVPYQRVLMNILVAYGFGVVYPRYRGTWESGGTFLAEQPSIDIARLAQRLRQGTLLGKSTVTASRISLLATSFGASVALSLADNHDIDQIVALSPVLDFRSFVGSESLKTFLQTMYSGSYRFTDETWGDLIAGNAVPSAAVVDETSAHKIYLFGGEKDEEVQAGQLRSWANKYSIPTRIYPNLGHLSFSKLEGQPLDDVIERL